MYHLIYDPNSSRYPICILTPHIRKDEIRKEYIEPHQIPESDIIVFSLHQMEGKKKTPMAQIKQYIAEELVPAMDDCGVKYIVCTDAEYFKALVGTTKAEASLGYVMPSVFGSYHVVYVPNYNRIFYNPDDIRGKIDQGMVAMLNHIKGSYTPPGASIIRYAAYPKTLADIEYWLERLIQENRPLTCDIEAFSLKHNTAGIGTITFCWNQHEGISFPVDFLPEKDQIRALLLSFFRRFKQKLIYHYIAYDAYVLIYQLFMKDILDTEGLLDGLETMLGSDWDDTKHITYLATNSCAGNDLSLKYQAQEFAGNWAIGDIEDITKIDLDDLLRYNLIDGLSTWYVYNKHWSTVIQDQQEDVYNTIFKPATIDIIQMQLTGMPVNMKRVKEVKAILEKDNNDALQRINNSPIVQSFVYSLNERLVEKKNAEYKVKRITLADVNEEFNPNSGPQLQKLLFEVLGLPVISLTDSKLPSTDGDTFKALLNHTQDPVILDFLKAMVDYKAVNKILTSFIPAMEGAVLGPDGWHYLFGNFNLGGTLSGRLSSSKPNLQNLPATGSKYAYLIKSCFSAPKGWMFAGLDFDSLEDKISGLTSKDPNKLKVYTDGYDGHSLRAYAYFKEQMPDIRQSDGKRAFKIVRGDTIIYLLEGDEVELPNGKIVAVEEASSLLSS